MGMRAQIYYNNPLDMSESKTLSKCKKIMDMFEKSKPSSALKERNDMGNLRTGVAEQRGSSFYLPSKKKTKPFEHSRSKLSFNNSNSSMLSMQKSVKSISSSQSNFRSAYNKETRYEKIMKLKVKPAINQRSYLNSSKVSMNSSVSSVDRSHSKQESRLDRIMKLKVNKPKVDSTLKNYQVVKGQRRSASKENINDNSILELKKCKQIIKKQEKQADK